MVATMDEVGQEFGCGRALWEYQSERLGSYGTPMAPMLLPHWTDGCIGSMEGLYFERRLPPRITSCSSRNCRPRRRGPSVTCRTPT